MIDVALRNIEKYYGANRVLEDITFEIGTGERVGVVGQNGCGKTTVFKIIAGIEKQDGGFLSTRKNASLGYLDQIPVYSEHTTVLDVLNGAFEELLLLKEQMHGLELDMAHASPSALEAIMKRYGEIQLRFEHQGGYAMEEKLSKVSSGLKLSEDFLHRNFASLSGGEKTTAILGKILLQSPDILLLDEPSNHLDLESIEWLEEYLKEYKGTVFIISHDRYFLDRVVQRIIEIEDGKASLYEGNYSYYADERERRLLLQFEAYTDQQKKIKAMENAIKDLRDWGNRGDNEKFFRRAASMQKRLDKIERLDRPQTDRAKIQLQLGGEQRSGKDVFIVKNLRKTFGDQMLLDQLHFQMRYGERVGLLGKNGSGKSTLLKILLEQLPFDSGEIKRGANLRTGYLEQEVLFPREDATILETFRYQVPVPEGRARSILAKFLFYGNDVFKKVGTLSGGEKSRLKLCLLMQEDLNLLVLDEPTNHLDIDSREALEEALTDFVGSILFISHDRYFINRMTNRIVELEAGRLVEYLGNYEDFKEKKLEKKLLSEKPLPPKEKKMTKPEAPAISKTPSKPQESLRKIEEKITLLEDQIRKKDLEMAEASSDYERLQKNFEEKSQLQSELDLLLETWLDLTSHESEM
ncbi:ATPase components of ABC transporters with duplicated ATPase domains [Geosporobacter subterraneus DSM 17957]|uniref:ATPase components of ABC transporters with duplicated ATPase domains n=1 Tax=Geosporobacter subterraneus DSM 17957 TaxID=1121919 RepID=A0A1M6L4Z5_9FIRM|nr:ABC-F family ATP-binding cassette domain-containing protein [Geosporobacter subterraneus]SHJ66280.1 ATPase components of ABC transporters with duplicated ATPase domains [Geosporobacter subterraneus DSM 17957]